MARIKEQEYRIIHYDLLNKRLVSPKEFRAVKRKFDNAFFLVNKDFMTKSNVNDIPDFDKVIFPDTVILEGQDEYRTLSEVQDRIKLIEKILQTKNIPKEYQNKKNEIDFQNELQDLYLLEDKYRFGEVTYEDIDDDGTIVLRYIRKGNILLLMGYNALTRKFIIPTDQQIQTHTTRKGEIDYNYPLKTESTFSFKNILMVALVVGLIILVCFNWWSISKYGEKSSQLDIKLQSCNDKLTGLNEKWASSNKEQVNKISSAIQKIANDKNNNIEIPPNAK